MFDYAPVTSWQPSRRSCGCVHRAWSSYLGTVSVPRLFRRRPSDPPSKRPRQWSKLFMCCCAHTCPRLVLKILKMSLPTPGFSLQLFKKLVPLGNMNRQSLLEHPEEGLRDCCVLVIPLKIRDSVALMIDVPLPTLNAAFGFLDVSLQERSLHPILPVSDGSRLAANVVPPPGVAECRMDRPKPMRPPASLCSPSTISVRYERTKQPRLPRSGQRCSSHRLPYRLLF
jgi:hypothetical protein